MKLFPQWAWPLNLFHVHGTFCCVNLQRSFESNFFMDALLCYEAQSIYEANVLLIWGSISTRLAESVCEYVDLMPKNKFLIHLRGCDARIDSDHSRASLANILPINAVLSSCELGMAEYKNLINEARRCLRA